MRVGVGAGMLLCLLAACTSGAESDGSDASQSETSSSGLPSPADPLPLDQLAQFSGVAAMNAGSNCTGTLIDTGVPNGPAYVLTNGHCTGDLSAGETFVDQPWFGTAEFLRADGNLDATLTVDVIQLAYATMRHTDTAIMRLDATLGELEGQGLQPVPIASAEPAPNQAVVNVGVPVQELLDDQWVLRRGECVLGAQHTLIEGPWLWFGAWSNDCPGIIQGSSGSPLLAVDAEGSPTSIDAMINTTTWGASPIAAGSCAIHHPCEVTTGGATMAENTSYAQSVAGIGSCFSGSTGEFALGGDCPLPVASVWATRGGGSFRGGDLPNAHGDLPSATLLAAEAGDVSTVVLALGDGSACQNPASYVNASVSQVPAATGEWDQQGASVPVTLPEQEGRFVLCAVHGDDYAGAANLLFDVDRTPPTIAADADVERLDDSVLVRPHLNPPELQTVRFTWGPAGTVDCADTPGFQDAFTVPLHLEAADLPATYCVYGMDAAGNATPATTIEIPK